MKIPLRQNYLKIQLKTHRNMEIDIPNTYIYIWPLTLLAWYKPLGISIDWLVFNANFSNIQLSWREQILLLN